ncbi:hypothetical protein [Actinomyces urogenitalis]|uniref:hypothetical protein n=1 Tax=Actinomyces urogenitalis TaxID=103621 RepID=UPI00242AAA88|nr:hypothetical protein [Actinomyces urogenitalis]MCI7456419.1 hypothetical protein [Actinomyces urogenitalis]
MKKPINERQVSVLKWIAQGCPEGVWPEGSYSYKTSAVALQDRGLITIRGRSESWTATVTEAGRYYLEHGDYPPVPRGQQSAPPRPARNNPKNDASAVSQARDLTNQLRTQGTITVLDPDRPTRARYRKALHACRTHELVPPGKELRFTGRDSGDIIIKLVAPSSTEGTEWNRIRLNTRRITTNIEALRTALETSSLLNEVSEDLRPRAIAILMDLAERLRVIGLPLGANLKLKTPKLFIQIGTKRRDVFLTEILDEIPHKLTAQEAREQRRHPWKHFPAHDQAPSGRLRLRVMRDGSHQVRDGSYTRYEPNADEYSDQNSKPLEKQVVAIARAVKKGVADDIAARELEERRRAEAKAQYEREEARKREAWKALRRRAREKALLQLREETFAQAFQNWQQAEELRVFATCLETAASKNGMLESRPRLQQWLQWARDRADAIDPIKNLAHLDDEVFDTEPSADDLRPHMEGWDPKRPEKDYTLAYRAPAEQSVPLPKRPWHPGMVGRPSWWR